MNSRRSRKFILRMLCACLAVSAVSEGGTPSSGGDGTEGAVPSAPDRSSCAAQNEFAAALLRGNYTEGASVCVAPLSLYSALAMTQNGARGSTLEQMSALLGGGPDAVNRYMSWYAASLSGDSQLRSANSLWVTDDTSLFVPKRQFTDTVREHYASELFTRPFPPADCTATVDDINSWTRKSTDGMIEKLIDSIPENTTMYLVNTAAFDARWDKPYTEDHICPRVFHAADGSEQEVDFMFSEESVYLRDDMASGFLKPYEKGRYVFAAVIPDEDVTLEKYVSSLTGRRFMDLLASAQPCQVSALTPKFSMEYDKEQSDIFKALGITDAFDDARADFSAMGDFPLGFNTYIGGVLHKTFIAVDENGTRAGAASAVEMHTRMTGVMGQLVCLDRPFLYAIVDMRTGAPVFFGTVSSVKEK